jgi:hypothetical protein
VVAPDARANICSLKPGAPICDKQKTELMAATQLQSLFGNQLFNTRCEWGEVAAGSSVRDKSQTTRYYPSSAFLTKERAVANQRKRLLRRLIGSTLCAPGIPDKAHNSFGAGAGAADEHDHSTPIGENHFEILADATHAYCIGQMLKLAAGGWANMLRNGTRASELGSDPSQCKHGWLMGVDFLFTDAEDKLNCFEGWEGSSLESDKRGALVLNVDGKVYESCESVQQYIKSPGWNGLDAWRHKSGFTDPRACFDKQLLEATRGANCIFKLPDFHTANQGELTEHHHLRRPHHSTDDDDDCAFRALETIVAQGHWGAYRMTYGAMSAAMLTPKPHAQHYLNSLKRYMKWPSAAPVIGMHVRRGDACKCTMTSCKTVDEGRVGTCFPLIDYVKKARLMKKK